MIFETFSCSGPNLHLYQSSFVDLGWSPGIGFNATALTTRNISGCSILLCLGGSPWISSALHSSVVFAGFALVAVSSQPGSVSSQRKHPKVHHLPYWPPKGRTERTRYCGQYPLPPHLPRGTPRHCPWWGQGHPRMSCVGEVKHLLSTQMDCGDQILLVPLPHA